MVSLGGNPTVTRCNIHDGKAPGIIVFNKGHGEFRNCEIYQNNVGFAVNTSGNPTVIGCKIHDEKGGGILVTEKGLGEFRECDIYGNTAGVGVMKEGNPTVIGCKIHNGNNIGVTITEKGSGKFYNNTLKDNQLSNWAIFDNAGKVKGSGNTPEIPKTLLPFPNLTP